MILNEKLKIPSSRELFKSFRTISTVWWYKTPNQKWCYIYAMGKSASKPIGLPLFESDQTIYWNAYLIYGIFGCYTLLALYTAYYYAIDGEPGKCLSSTCLLGIASCILPYDLSAISKNRGKYHSLLTFAGRYIYPDNHGRTEYNQICSEQMDSTIRSFLIRILMIFLAAFAAVFGPIYVYLSQGIKTTTTEVKIPFADNDENIEYIMNMILQFMNFIYGSLVYYSLETAMAIFGDVIKVTPKLIKNQLNALIEMYERKEISELQLRFAFKNITKQLLDYENFVSDLRDFLYWRTLVTPILFTYSIGMAIFCQYTMGFVAGYGMAVMSWVQLYFLCETGQDIEDNRLDEILYNSEWYHLPRDLQKDLMHLINQRQNRITLNVGPFAIINRELFKNATNRIYTFIMFLLNFST